MVIMNNGYIEIMMPEHPNARSNGTILEHRLMAEKKLGRLLTKEECVHHIDGNRCNNSFDNLIVFKTNADHIAFHRGNKMIQEGDVWYCPDKGYVRTELCPICHINYKDKQADMCIECWDNLKNKFIKNTNIERPSREILKEKIRTSNFLQIGKEYGVSDNAVRKWCKFYGLPFKSHIIKSLSDEEWENECFNNTK